jgi:hypothetical protein
MSESLNWLEEGDIAEYQASPEGLLKVFRKPEERKPKSVEWENPKIKPNGHK